MLEPKYIVKFGEKLPEEALAKPGEVSLNVSEFFFDTIQVSSLFILLYLLHIYMKITL